MRYTIPTVNSKSKRLYSVTSLLTPHAYLLFPFWFACFWVLIGTAWRPPLASAGLLALFLVLLVAIEWITYRLTSKSMPLFPLTKSDYVESMVESVCQQITRFKTAEGLDRLDGTFLAEFPAETMTTTIHIPFCPAFGRIPNIQVFPLDETDAGLRVISSKTFGMRVDVKRNNSAVDRLRFAVIAEG